MERLFNLLNRLLIKEVAQTDIFSDLHLALEAKRKYPEIKWSDLEVILVIRWLHYLGYLPGDSELIPYLRIFSWDFDQIQKLQTKTKTAISTINKSLRASGL